MATLCVRHVLPPGDQINGGAQFLLLFPAALFSNGVSVYRCGSWVLVTSRNFKGVCVPARVAALHNDMRDLMDPNSVCVNTLLASHLAISTLDTLAVHPFHQQIQDIPPAAEVWLTTAPDCSSEVVAALRDMARGVKDIIREMLIDHVVGPQSLLSTRLFHRDTNFLVLHSIPVKKELSSADQLKLTGGVVFSPTKTVYDTLKETRPNSINSYAEACCVIVKETKLRFLSPNDVEPLSSIYPFLSSNQPFCPFFSRVDPAAWIRDVCTDVGGVRHIASEIIHSIHKQLELRASIPPTESSTPLPTFPTGILLHGAPGIGKSLLVEVIAGRGGLPMIVSPGSQVFRTNVGESESFLNNVMQNALEKSPCIVVLDELDVLVPKISDESVSKSSVAALLLEWLQYLHDPSMRQNPMAKSDVSMSPHKGTIYDTLSDVIGYSPAIPRCVFVIGLTNRISGIDMEVRRPGRLELDIELKTPSPAARLEILEICSRRSSIKSTSNQVESESDRMDVLRRVNDKCHGFVGSDIQNLCREAAMAAVKRQQKLADPILPSRSKETSFEILYEDFENALQIVRPLLLANRMTALPSVTFDDLAGMDDVIETVDTVILGPLRNPNVYRALRISAPKGILIYGPPGTGKSTLAQAIARAAQINLIAVDGPQIIHKVVGESEKELARLFQQARASSPCILFIDQIEALAPVRGSDSSAEHTFDRILSTLLVEMDGLLSGQLSSNSGDSMYFSSPILLAATSRRELLDPAILRPGRLDEHIALSLPDEAARTSILNKKLSRMCIQEGDREVIVKETVQATSNCTGADLENLCREAAMICLREDLSNPYVEKKHFEMARQALRLVSKPAASAGPIAKNFFSL
eukprot:GILK01011666.1.p1 GENE.GILK01011666.1~~GILK01011666.1.p1  ORF type:complete len:867 (+),score=112.71 GILK01011666.1:45-2645(+)